MGLSTSDNWEHLLERVAEGSPTERHLAIQQAVTYVLASAEALTEAFPAVLRAVCLTLDWQVGAAWSVDRQAGVLRCETVWHEPNLAVPGFERLTRSMTFVRGVGLPGLVWESRSPAFIADVTVDEKFPRAPMASKEGLHGAIGFPILVGEELYGCLEFFSQEIQPPDEGLLVAMGAVGLLVGQFIHRLRAVEAVRAGEAERTRILRQLEDAVRARDQFMSIASHELRTPLTALLLQLQMVVRSLSKLDLGETGTAHVRMVGLAVRQAQRLSKLINSLLDVSRIASGKLELLLERFDLADAVGAILETMTEAAERAGCSVTLEEEAGILGDWDRLRLEQVVTNLVGNALKYAAGAPIEVKVARHGSMARLQVCDHGPGIAPDRAERIFDRFEQVSSGGAATGLGLGLYITREIVKAHGGTIHVESNPGDGCRFTVELPLEPPSG